MMDLEQRAITCSHCHGTYFDPEALVNHIKNVHCNIRLPIIAPSAENSESELPILQQESNKNSQNSPRKKEIVITKEPLNKVLDDSEKNGKFLTNIKCTLCSETFTNYEELNHHLSWTLEDSEKDFICQFCRKMFKKKKCLVYHMKSEHRKLLIMAISPKNEYDNSVESVAPQVDLTIIQKESKKGFENSPTRLQTSLFDEKLSSPKRCNLCFEYFSNKESYKSHVKTIAEDANRLFSCQFCDKVFKKRQCLISHLKSIHKKRAMNSSSNVEKQKNSSDKIENTKPVHQKSTVTMENSGKIEDNLPRISCESCSEPFSNKGELSLHLLWTPEDSKKAFLCQFCQKLFEKRRCLEYHLKSVHKKMPLSEEFQEKIKNAQTKTSQSPAQSIISTPVKVVSQMEKSIIESPKSQNKKTPIVPRILKKNHKINDGISIKKVEISGKQKRGASADIEVLDEISPPKKMMKIPNVKLVYQQGKFL